MIQLIRVSKSFGSHAPALMDISLSVGKGEWIYVTGPSGAGKSTLLHLLLSKEQPDAGQLMISGRNVGRLRPSAIPYLRRNIGMVFQDFKLLRNRTVEENVAIPLHVLGLEKEEVANRVFARLREVGLAHKAHHLPDTLAGGEQQRVAMARALVAEPQILLADEPTGNLDRVRSHDVMALFQAAHARGTTIIIATHDTELLHDYPHRTVRLERGQQVS